MAYNITYALKSEILEFTINIDTNKKQQYIII